MNTQDFTLTLFCRIDDAMPDLPKHPLAKLHPSEVITLGLLRALRGGSDRAFVRWMQRELGSLFPRLPERTRLFRLLHHFASYTQRFLASPTLFGIIDSYGIELLHPRRRGRSAQQIGRFGISNGRWIMGAKLCVLCNAQGQIVNWDSAIAPANDTRFHPLVTQVQEQMIVLADSAFLASRKPRYKKTNPPNLLICARHQWPARRLIETIFSMFTTVLGLKKLSVRSWPGLNARLAYTVAAYNLCITWNSKIKLQLAPFAL